MKKALLERRSEPEFPNGYRIAQVVEDGHEFEVAPSLEWVDCPDEVTERWQYNGEHFAPPAPLRDPVDSRD